MTRTPPPVWHPFTPMAAHRRESIPEIVAADGFELIAADGRRYLDGISSLWCNLHGHRVPEIDEALRDQLTKVAHSTLLGLESDVSNRFARRLVDVAPDGLNHCFYSDSGSTAVEAALKIAWQFQRQKPNPEPHRDLFVTISNAYHGDTIGAVSVGAIDLFHAAYGSLLFETMSVPSPAYTCWSQHSSEDAHHAHATAELEQAFREHGHRMAAIVIEPIVQGAAGILVHPNGYLADVRRLCHQYGVLMIADEVAVGFGRTGSLFACEQEFVSPDIMCLAKGITGGYLPLAATLTTTEIYNAFLGEPDEGRTFFHGHTYTGNSLACAAAIASLDLFEQSAVLENSQSLARELSLALAPLEHHPQVGQVRLKGTMVGIELVASRSPLMAFDSKLRLGHRVTQEARSRGVVIRPLGDVVVLMPAPAMSVDILRRIIQATLEAIDAATAAALINSHDAPQ